MFKAKNLLTIFNHRNASHRNRIKEHNLDLEFHKKKQTKKANKLNKNHLMNNLFQIGNQNFVICEFKKIFLV